MRSIDCIVSHSHCLRHILFHLYNVGDPCFSRIAPSVERLRRSAPFVFSRCVMGHQVLRNACGVKSRAGISPVRTHDKMIKTTMVVTRALNPVTTFNCAFRLHPSVHAATMTQQALLNLHAARRSYMQPDSVSSYT